jgi:vacuolar-type H+-ATPase subunit H
MSIENLRKAENKADKIIQDSKQKAQEMIRKSQKDANALIANAKDEAEVDIKTLQKKSKQAIDKEDKKIKAEKTKTLATVEESSKKNQKAAVDIIVKSITGNK